MKNYRFKSLVRVLAIVLVAVVLGVVSVSTITNRGISEAETAWHLHIEGSSKKALILTRLRDAFGYGGMIHELKNFVLRGDRPRIIRIHRRLRDISVSLIAYDHIASLDIERAAIKNLGDVLNQYTDATVVAERLVAAKAAPANIDRAIRIDDGPALAALETLDQHLFAEHNSTAHLTELSLQRVKAISLIGTFGAALLLAALIFIVFWLARTQLLTPIENLNRVMRALADGDHAIRVPYLDAKNEIGEVAGAVQVFKETVIHTDRLEQDRRRQEEEKEPSKPRPTPPICGRNSSRC